MISSPQLIRRTVYLAARALIFVSCIVGITVLSVKLQHEDSFYTDGDGDIQDVTGIIGFSFSLAWTIVALLLFYFRRNKSNASPPYHRAFDMICDPIAAVLVVALVYAYAAQLNYDYRDLECLYRDPNCHRFAGLMNRLQATSYGFAVVAAATHFFITAWSFAGWGLPKAERVPLSHQ
ncbi:hypothetical protein BT69DRAFT_1275816 [Atractiella rhizophila]|nr:hypothetical protein BT69DRAFT_1275816 [Atractiella rhizophila]